MDSFFGWLESLAKEPIGLAFLFGASALFWLGWLRKGGQRLIAYILRITYWLRQARIALAWWLHRPLVEIVKISDISVNEDGNEIEYGVDLKLKITNRDNGIAVVFIENLAVTLIQKRGVTLKYRLEHRERPMAQGRIDLETEGQTKQVDIHLSHRFLIRNNWTLVPIDFSQPYELHFSAVHAGIGITTDVPDGVGLTRLLNPKPKKRKEPRP